MKNRKHIKYEGFPEKTISYHSKDYAGAMGSGDSDAYQGEKPADKIAVANEMSKHHGAYEGEDSNQNFVMKHPIVSAAAGYGAYKGIKAIGKSGKYVAKQGKRIKNIAKTAAPNLYKGAKAAKEAVTSPITTAEKVVKSRLAQKKVGSWKGIKKGIGNTVKAVSKVIRKGR